MLPVILLLLSRFWLFHREQCTATAEVSVLLYRVGDPVAGRVLSKSYITDKQTLTGVYALRSRVAKPAPATLH